MNETQNTPPSNGQTNGSTQEAKQDTPSQGFCPDQELVYRLKNAIDTRGRYSFRLNDMAAGFAAGKEVTNAEARGEIENKFSQHTGQSPQEYLDHHYSQRQQSRGRDSEQSQDRGR